MLPGSVIRQRYQSNPLNRLVVGVAPNSCLLVVETEPYYGIIIAPLYGLTFYEWIAAAGLEDSRKTHRVMIVHRWSHALVSEPSPKSTALAASLLADPTFCQAVVRWTYGRP